MSESLADPTGRKPTVIFFKKVLNTAVADEWLSRRVSAFKSGWSFHARNRSPDLEIDPHRAAGWQPLPQ